MTRKKDRDKKKRRPYWKKPKMGKVENLVGEKDVWK